MINPSNEQPTAAEVEAVVPDVLAPAKLGPIQLRNRIIKAATYENKAREGLVTDALIDFHVEHAAGGVAMTTVAYCAVSPDGRTDGNQIVWRPEAVAGLRKLTDAVHAEGAAISAQIGHSGPVGDSRRTGHAALSPSVSFNPLSSRLTKAATEADLDRVVENHAAAALMAIDCGFDAVEIHIGHNYLLSSFLSPRLNRRTDRYGGSLANRARLALRVTQAVRDAVGDRIAVLAKLNMDDGVPGGFWLDEAIQVAQWLDQAGTLDAVEMTVGSSLLNPMYLFKGDAPVHDFAEAMQGVQRLAVKAVGKWKIREYPYQDGFMLEDARQIRAAISTPMVLLGGITDMPVMERAMAEGFEFVAMARALLREPDLINRLVKDRGTRSLCNHNNKCMVSTFTDTRCVLVPVKP